MEMGLEIIKALSFSPTKLNILEIVRDWKNLSEISDRIKLKKQTLVPHLKVLVELGLVKKDGGMYKLTEIGKLTLEKFLETVKFFDVVGNLGDFFNEHDLSPIPPHLLREVHMLFGGKVHIKENPYEFHPEWLEVLQASSWICGLSSIYHSDFPEMFTRLSEKRN